MRRRSRGEEKGKKEGEWKRSRWRREDKQKQKEKEKTKYKEKRSREESITRRVYHEVICFELWSPVVHLSRPKICALDQVIVF